MLNSRSARKSARRGYGLDEILICPRDALVTPRTSNVPSDLMPRSRDPVFASALERGSQPEFGGSADDAADRALRRINLEGSDAL